MKTSIPGTTPTTGRSVVNDLLPRRGPSRLLGRTAVFWLGSAVVHSVVFGLSGTAWSGAVSWRKPIVFSLSMGLLLWAFAWILDRLPDRRLLAWPLAVLFSVSSTVEVGLITGQQWRGRASHFNTFAADDAAVFAMMGVAVGVMSLMLAALFIWSLVERPADRLERTAAIAGMAMVIAGLGIGQWILSLGFEYVDRFNRVPDTVMSGEAGVAKFPHAVAFHGIQVFMVAAVLLARSGVSSSMAKQSMRLIVAAYSGVLAFSALQSFGGRAPLDLDVVSGVLLAISAMVLVSCLGMVTRWWWAAEFNPSAPPVGRPRTSQTSTVPAPAE